MSALDSLLNIAVDIAESTGAIELLRQRLERFLEKWPERDELLARFRLLSEQARRSFVHRIALHLAVHKLDNAQLLELVKDELARAERG